MEADCLRHEVGVGFWVENLKMHWKRKTVNKNKIGTSVVAPNH